MVEIDPVQVQLIARDAASQVLEEFQRHLENTERKANKASAGVRAFGKTLRNLAIALGVTVGLREFVRVIGEVAEIGGKADTSMTSLRLTMGSMADQMIGKLRTASRGTVSDLELVMNANRALALGIDQNKLPELMEVARARARVMGITVTQAFNDITTGIGRQSKLILDNLGIVFDLENVNSRYAATLGKQADKLTEVERKQALVNAVLENSADIVEKQNKITGSAQEQLEQLTAEWENMKAEIGKELLPVLVDIGNELIENKDAIKDTSLAVVEFVRAITPLVALYAQFVSDVRGMNALSSAGAEPFGWVGKVAEQLPGANFMFARLGGEISSNLIRSFRDSELAFDEWAASLKLTDDQVRALKVSYGEMIAALDERRKIEIDTSDIDAAADGLQSIEDSLKAFSQLNEQADARLDVLDSILQAAERAGDFKIGIDDNLANSLGFQQLSELKDFLQQNDIFSVNNEGTELQVQAAQRRIEIAKEDLDIEEKRLKAVDKINSVIADEAEFRRQVSQLTLDSKQAEEDRVVSTQDFIEIINSEGGNVLAILEDQAAAEERGANAAERKAKALREQLESLRAIAEFSSS